MTYVDGFVLSVPEANIEAYRAMADAAGKIWIEHGALEYKECVGEDLEDKGFCLSFPQMVHPKQGETIIFAYIVFHSREHRDEVNAKVHADPRLEMPGGIESLPFDCARMSYGGFKTIVELSAPTT